MLHLRWIARLYQHLLQTTRLRQENDGRQVATASGVKDCLEGNVADFVKHLKGDPHYDGPPKTPTWTLTMIVRY